MYINALNNVFRTNAYGFLLHWYRIFTGIIKGAAVKKKQENPSSALKTLKNAYGKKEHWCYRFDGVTVFYTLPLWRGYRCDGSPGGVTEAQGLPLFPV